ncbi:phospholipase D family protein [Luteolibacter flavescens]|uniref:Phospholipase D family protein n=1 Tax=Luteolibacter flavescens TaxID=1859460 RepID=A0ABT3FT06_9BACT|nr:phospholipase D family protein [Luteolibacter flavescens]MCW1886718.1 phospholipase D family protein [Luteolibacter flavescens]
MPPSKETPSYSPLDLITKGSWDHALFTTYSLSLSFYETQLHKLGLARNGCRDIRIVADADGYQLSLSERQSHRVGNEYRLTPAALPNGVFHPKFIWLAGKQIDLVLLGSGNLTFGGFGRNVECLDQFRSDRHQATFGEMRGLLKAWSARADLRFSEQNWLDFWIDRATRISAGSQASEPTFPKLLHSTDEPIGVQLAKYLADRGQVTEVRSLSPFYDPDGDGIITFAELIGAPKLSIGLLPGRDESSTFPFTRNRPTSVEIQAARFPAPEDGRILHAKVIEIHLADGTSLLLTGSVNATRKSLLTADNIETALLRHATAADDSPFGWAPAEIPAAFKTSKFTKAGLGTRVIVSGRLTPEGLLKGRLLSTSDPQGTWDATLQRIDGTFTNLSITVDSEGEFSDSVEQLELFQDAAGLQLHVSKDQRSGSGWVSVEGLLLAARRGFLSPATLMKLLGTDPDESDEAELLRYLANSAHRHLPAFASPIQRRSERGGRKTDVDQGVTRSEVPIGTLLLGESSESPDSPDAKDRAEETMLNIFMHRIRANLLRPRLNEEDVQELDEIADDKAAERQQKERERTRKHLVVSLRDFQDKLQQLVTELPSGDERSAALCMWLEVAFPLLLKRLDEPDEAESFLRRWLSLAISGQRHSNSTDVLSGHILSSLLVVAATVIEREDGSPSAGRALGRLHEQMESFCEDAPPGELCELLGILLPEEAPLTAGLLKSLPGAPALSEALAAVLGTPTPRQQLRAIREASSSDVLKVAELPILSLPAGQQLRNQCASGRHPEIKDLAPGRENCPHCYLKIPSAALHEIRRDRLGICRSCHKYLLASL